MSGDSCRTDVRDSDFALLCWVLGGWWVSASLLEGDVSVYVCAQSRRW
jgi:hypothetical protein